MYARSILVLCCSALLMPVIALLQQSTSSSLIHLRHTDFKDRQFNAFLNPIPEPSFFQEHSKRVSHLEIPLHKVVKNASEEEAYEKTLTEHHRSILSLDQKENFLSIESIKVRKNQVKTYALQLTSFVGKIAVGTPPQEFNIIYDTGSSFLWINSDNCNVHSCMDHPRFMHKKSSTFQPQGINVNVTFGTGQISGNIVKDTVTLGPVIILNQKFGSVEKEYGSVWNLNFEGVMGLALPELCSQDTVIPVFENMVQQHRLTKTQFSFYYNDQASNLDHSTRDHASTKKSALVFGEPPAKYFIPPIKYINIDKRTPGYWQVVMKDIYAVTNSGEKALGLCPHGACKAVADTGTALLTTPSSALETVLKQFEIGKNCNLKNMPSMKFVFKDGDKSYDFTLEPEYYVRRHKSGNCSIAVMSLDVSKPRGPLFILGNVFMQKFFTVYSVNPNKLGIAIAK